MTHTAGFLHAGITAARNNDKQVASEQLRLHLEQEPRSEAGWLWLASVCETAEERLACIARVLDINPANERALAWLAPSRAACAQELLTRGVAAAKSTDAETARELLQRAVELDPTKELAWLWLASVSVAPVEKLAHLQRVLVINPTNGHALTGIKHARTALAQTLLQQATVAARSGARELASARLREAIVHDEGVEDAWLLSAYLTDEAEEKVNHLRRALDINPHSTRARSALNALEAQLAPPAPAWRCPLCDESGEAPRDICTSCDAHLALDDIEAFFANDKVDARRLHDSVARLRARFETSEATSEDYYHLGLALLNLRETEEGIEYLRAALRLNPLNENLATAIKAILIRQKPARQEQVGAHAATTPESILPVVEQSEVHEAPSELFVEPCESFTEANESFTERHVSSSEQTESFAVSGDFSDAATLNGAPVANRTIMIVDDSPTVRKLVTIKLEKQGHRVIPAVDGMEALALLNDDLPDLILLDITMPRLDGYQLCKLIRANDATKHIPVVMLSGKDGFFDKVRGRMAGSTDYLTKPFEPEMLLRVVAEHCGTSVT